MIRIFVGTDERQGEAERALEHSLRKHSSVPLDITWMRAGEPGFQGWNGQPKMPLQAGCWATRFTNFRYAVPELAGFDGIAVYIDSDMLFLDDPAKLLEIKRKAPWSCVSLKRTDVSIIDCAYFKDRKWWPRIEQMRKSNLRGAQYRYLLRDHGAMSHDVHEQWDHLDNYQKGYTKNVHFTFMPTQPWRPWPESMSYRPHPCPKAVELWREYSNAASTKPATPATDAP